MMQLSQNKARQVDGCHWLTKCFSEYFAPGQFVYDRSHLVDVKWRDDGQYCVMLFEVDGELMGADVAGYSRLTGESYYDVCNDSLDFGDIDEWRGVRVDPYCDGFTTREDRE